MTDAIASLRAAAQDVCNETFVRVLDNGQVSRVPISWPEQLGIAIIEWLDAGRPSDERFAQLFPLMQRVDDGDWAVVWQDPGPRTGCSLAPAPTVVRLDDRPLDLTRDLQRMIDELDMADPQGASS